MRLSNSLPASMLVLIGAGLCQSGLPGGRAWLAAGAMWCITAFGYVSNDLADIDEDRINKPDRPLPSGLISQRMAARLALGLALVALAISVLLGWLAFSVAVCVLAILSAYNQRLKGAPAVGNFVVALLAGGALLTGAVAVCGPDWGILQMTGGPAALLIVFIFAREALKTAEDLAGDRSVGKHTLALAWGAEKTARWLLLPAALTLVIGGWLWAAQDYSTIFILLVATGVTLPLVYSAIRLWRNAAPQRVSHCLALLKGSYFVGLAALLLR